jgi:hypothetical protein
VVGGVGGGGWGGGGGGGGGGAGGGSSRRSACRTGTTAVQQVQWNGIGLHNGTDHHVAVTYVSGKGFAGRTHVWKCLVGFQRKRSQMSHV